MSENYTMTLREVTVALGVCNKRVYQLDELLQPERIPRGKYVSRMYDPAVVARAREARVQRTGRLPGASRRSSSTKKREQREAVKSLARAAAVKWLEVVADQEEFDAALPPATVEAIRAEIRKIGARVARSA